MDKIILCTPTPTSYLIICCGNQVRSTGKNAKITSAIRMSKTNGITPRIISAMLTPHSCGMAPLAINMAAA
jgi:hypothetical protein